MMVGDQICPDMTVIEDINQINTITCIKGNSPNAGAMRVEYPFYFMCVAAEGEFKLNSISQN